MTKKIALIGFMDYNESSYSYCFFDGAISEIEKETKILKMAGHKDVFAKIIDLDGIKLSKSIKIDTVKPYNYYHLKKIGDKISITSK